MSSASRILLFHEIEVGGFAAALEAGLADFGLEVEVGPLPIPPDAATDSAAAIVVLVRPHQLGRYREIVRHRALFVTAGRAPADIPVTPDVVHFANVSRSRPVASRRLSISEMPSLKRISHIALRSAEKLTTLPAFDL